MYTILTFSCIKYEFYVKMLKFKHIFNHRKERVNSIKEKLSIIKYYYIRFKRYKNTCNCVKKIIFKNEFNKKKFNCIEKIKFK